MTHRKISKGVLLTAHDEHTERLPYLTHLTHRFDALLYGAKWQEARIKICNLPFSTSGVDKIFSSRFSSLLHVLFKPSDRTTKMLLAATLTARALNISFLTRLKPAI